MIALFALTIASEFATVSSEASTHRGCKNSIASEIRQLVKRSPLLNFKIIPSAKVVPTPNLKKLPLKKIPLKKLLLKKKLLKKLVLKKTLLKKLSIKKLPLKKLKKFKILWNAKKLKLLKKGKKPGKLPIIVRPSGLNNVKIPDNLLKPGGVGEVDGVGDVATFVAAGIYNPLRPPPPVYHPCTPAPYPVTFK